MAFDPKDIFSPTRIKFLENSEKNAVLNEMVELLATSPRVTDKADLLNKILEREKTLSTGVGSGLALPHVKIASVMDFVVAIGISHKGIEFDSLDKKPAHIVVMIGCHESQSGEYMKLLSKLVRSLKEEVFRSDILESESPEEVYALITGPEGIY